MREVEWICSSMILEADWNGKILRQSFTKQLRLPQLNIIQALYYVKTSNQIMRNPFTYYERNVNKQDEKLK